MKLSFSRSALFHMKTRVSLKYFVNDYRLGLTVNLLDVIEVTLGTENFTILFDGIPIAKRMCLKGGHKSTMFLCTLQKPYKIPGLEPTALIFLRFATLETPDDFKEFRYSSIRFSWLTVKFSKPFLLSNFSNLVFSNLALSLRGDSICLI